MIVTVMGATGNTGGVVARKLLAAGIEVRAVGRSADKLARLVKEGAKAAVADATSPAELTRVAKGSDALYALIPPLYTAPDLLAYYAEVADAIARAVRDGGVRKVVFLSSLGAEHASGTGPIVGLHRAEETLKGVPGIDLVLLRPGSFYENTFSSLGLIKQQGINGGATAPDVAITMIAAGDIGAMAATILRQGDFSGVSVRELFGPRDLTMTEVTRVLGSKIGKPDLAYVRFPDEGVVGALQAAGFSRDIAQKFVEMSQAFNEGKVRASGPRAPANTGSTTFEAFADLLAHAYRAG